MSSLTFEQSIIVVGAFALVFLSVNILAFIKFAYLLRKRRGDSKEKKESDSFSPANQTSHDSEIDRAGKKVGKESKKGIMQLIKKPFKFLYKVFHFLIVRPLSPKCFFDKYKQGYNIPMLNKKISFLLLWSMRITLFNILIIIFLFTLVKRNFLSYPQIIGTYPVQNHYWNDYDKPIEITFDVPVNKESLILNMAPETQGKWEFEESFSFLPFTRKAYFYPNETIFPGEKIMVYLTDLTNHFHTMDGGEHLLEFKSIDLPQIDKTKPKINAKGVAVDQPLELELTHKDGVYVDWDFEFNKKLKYKLLRDNSNKIKVDFNHPLDQSKKYKVDIFQTPLSYNLENDEITKKGERKKVYSLKFKTVKAPLISSKYPEGTHIRTDEKVKVVFDQKMDKDSVEKAFSINPQVPGNISWENDRTLLFTPDKLKKAAHYTVSFKRGMRSENGGLSESRVQFSFDTIGYVSVAGWYPGYGATGISTSSNIRITFDQEVAHSSAESKFNISPNVNGRFSWSGNIMTFTPSSKFKPNKRYTITISPGVKTVHGLDSNKSFTSYFDSEVSTFMLKVPLYSQTHTFTCNVTAAAMVLSYKGVSSSEMSVYSGIAKDNTSCKKNGDTITRWGNPNTGYVGDINGGGKCGGYGVHWGPVSSYISSRGISNQVISGWSAAQVAREVKKGHPVIRWGQNGWASPTWKSWSSPTGNVSALNGMHSEVVVGFVGPADNPVQIITNDPWRGVRHLSIAEFYGVWGYFGRRGIVVY